jgi:hypothetical protein
MDLIGSTPGGGLHHLGLTPTPHRGYRRRVRTFLLAVFAALVLASPAAAAPAWLAPVDVGAETTDPSSIGRVAVGPDGTAVAAWAQSNGSTNWDLQVARRKPGEGFGAAITVPVTTGVQGVSVRVGVDGAGNATILYELGGALVILPWPAASGEPGPKQPLEAGGFGELAVGRNGTAVAAWLENPTSMGSARVRAAVRPGPTGDFGASAPISQFGDGTTTPTITGLDVAVGDGGHATVVWARDTAVNNIIGIEANERAPGGNFTPLGTSLSPFIAPDLSSQSVVAVDPSGRSTVLWTRSGFVRYAEHGPSDPFWSTEQRVSTLPDVEDSPAVGAAPSGAVVAAWRSGNAVVSATRPPGGGAFATAQPLSGPGMNPQLPQVAVGGNGDALISWELGDGSAIPTVQRKADGSFGPILNAVTKANQPAGEDWSFFRPSLGIDDEGNGIAGWTRNAFRGGTNFNRFQVGSFDAAPPTLTASVPPGGALAAPIGMAASAFDRVSPVGFAWSFGDGTTATGGAVSHAFGTAGAFNVTVTATDAAGNASSATNPVLIAAGPPPKKKRITSKVKISWGVTSTKTFLVRLKVPNVPKRGKAQITCTPKKKCPFKKVSSKKRRKGAITLFKNVKTSKLAGMKKRTFVPGARVELRITAPGYIGKVLRYKLKRAKVPVAKTLCLPVGAKKPRRTCN